MAVTRLTDVVVPEVFDEYMRENTKYKFALYQAGVIRDDGDLSKKLAGGGRTFNVPFWRDLSDDEGNIPSDDPSDVATALGLTSGTDIAARLMRTQGWGAARLAGDLAGSNPMDRINARVAAYWARQFDTMSISLLRGVFADNAANDSGDMQYSIATDDAGAITAAELISAPAVMEAAQTMGDEKEALQTIVMHSVVNKRLAENDLIDYRPDSTGKILVPHYLDYRVVVSDACPAIAGTNRVNYWTFLLGEGAIGMGESPPDTPVEVDSQPAQGNGRGVETLWTRRQIALHVYGVKFTDTSVAGEFMTNAELMTAGNWDRVAASRKHIPAALLITNG